MPKVRFAVRTATRTAAIIQGRMKLARLMEMPEGELEDLARRLESDPLFGRLSMAGVVSRSGFSAARFAARRFAGYGLRQSGSGLPELVDGNCDMARLMRSIGQERFEMWFLTDSPYSDEERARGCGITPEQARKLRGLMDEAFIRGEFDGPAPSAPGRVYSAVAAFQIEGGGPVLAFFHRDIWERRYRVDRERLDDFLKTLPPGKAAKARSLLSQVEAVEQRKTTLYRVLEEVLKAQADYLCSGEPAKRKPLAQKEMAKLLDRDPSVINRLISNKSVQLPWGVEAPLSAFFPSAKDINRERLYALIDSNPALIDAALAAEMERLYGVRLSRRSIAQYRKELALGSSLDRRAH